MGRKGSKNTYRQQFCSLCGTEIGDKRISGAALCRKCFNAKARKRLAEKRCNAFEFTQQELGAIFVSMMNSPVNDYDVMMKVLGYIKPVEDEV